MTSTIAGRTAAPRSAPAAPPAAPLGRLPRRRRVGMQAIGVVLVCVAAAGAYLLYSGSGVTHPYLAVVHNVAYGATISAEDLTVIDVNPAAGLQPIPAAQRDTVIGKHAAVDLVAGTLLTPAELTTQTVPAPGQQLVGIELRAGQLPARSLKTGDAVLLVVVPATSVGAVPDAQPTPLSSPPTIPATVVAEAAPDTTGNVRVDVAVAQSDGPTVAAMAAAGRIVLVVTTRAGS